MLVLPIPLEQESLHQVQETSPQKIVTDIILLNRHLLSCLKKTQFEYIQGSGQKKYVRNNYMEKNSSPFQ